MEPLENTCISCGHPPRFHPNILTLGFTPLLQRTVRPTDLVSGKPIYRFREELKGGIPLSSKVDEGTMFNINLPVHELSKKLSKNCDRILSWFSSRMRTAFDS
ncbi:MAG: hypothetical protein COA73_14450 [Candidatus Hydrogenedentota bacterium]|nr:MAG: hypothetical protein COA73_14450 [Candidatus Hydrogenedentota bacterium]